MHHNSQLSHNLSHTLGDKCRHSTTKPWPVWGVYFGWLPVRLSYKHATPWWASAHLAVRWECRPPFAYRENILKCVVTPCGAYLRSRIAPHSSKHIGSGLSYTHEVPFSGKLSRVKTFANFAVLWLYAKVFSPKFGANLVMYRHNSWKKKLRVYPKFEF